MESSAILLIDMFIASSDLADMDTELRQLERQFVKSHELKVKNSRNWTGLIRLMGRKASLQDKTQKRLAF
jgi:hypothetical protein